MNLQPSDAERGLLGAVLVDNLVMAQAVELVSPEDFSVQSHRRVYEVMLTLHETNQPIDLITVRNGLGSSTAASATWLAGLLDGVPKVSSIESWAKIITSSATARRLVAAADKIRELATGEQPDHALSEAIGLILAAGAKSDASFRERKSLMRDSIALLEKHTSKVDGIPGIPLGIRTVDEMTGGMMPGQLWVLAARPGCGKTSAAIGIADNAARLGKTVAFFSLEMTGEELTNRRLALRSGVSKLVLKHKPEKWADVNREAARIASDPLHVVDRSGLKVSRIKVLARRLKAEHGLDLIVIDFLQLVKGDTKAQGRFLEVGEIARGLHELSKEMGVPVLALSQLSRDIEKREGGKPRLSDLRESGEIEQAAHTVIFLHREGDRSEWICEKNRDGPVFFCEVNYRPDVFKFSDKE